MFDSISYHILGIWRIKFLSNIKVLAIHLPEANIIIMICNIKIIFRISKQKFQLAQSDFLCDWPQPNESLILKTFDQLTFHLQEVH